MAELSTALDAIAVGIAAPPAGAFTVLTMTAGALPTAFVDGQVRDLKMLLLAVLRSACSQAALNAARAAAKAAAEGDGARCAVIRGVWEALPG